MSPAVCGKCQGVIFSTSHDCEPSEGTPAATGALRFDTGKARMDLISPIAIKGLAQVLEVGSRKYAPNNWRKGMDWSRAYGSLLRHMFAFIGGEDCDSETGLPHVDHIACNAMFLQEYFRTHPELDDRYKGTVGAK